MITYNKKSNYGEFEGFAFQLIGNGDHFVVGYADEELDTHPTEQEYFDWETRLWNELECQE